MIHTLQPFCKPRPQNVMDIFEDIQVAQRSLSRQFQYCPIIENRVCLSKCFYIFLENLHQIHWALIRIGNVKLLLYLCPTYTEIIKLRGDHMITSHMKQEQSLFHKINGNHWCMCVLSMLLKINCSCFKNMSSDVMFCP